MGNKREIKPPMCNVENRFELVMVSSKRARQLANEGKEAMVPLKDDKPTVLALREIADGFVNADILSEPKIDHSEVLSLATEDEFSQPKADF